VRHRQRDAEGSRSAHREGETDEQILQAFVQEYGTQVYTEPPKSGFSLVAWVLPSVYLFVALEW